jgi:hypothetical protein
MYLNIQANAFLQEQGPSTNDPAPSNKDGGNRETEDESAVQSGKRKEQNALTRTLSLLDSLVPEEQVGPKK